MTLCVCKAVGVGGGGGENPVSSFSSFFAPKQIV